MIEFLSAYRGELAGLLIVVAVLSLVFPAFGARVKGWLAQAKQAAGSVASGLSVDQLVQQRAAALKAACPGASNELHLKWLTAGYDEHRARCDYITELEKAKQPS